jgi:ribosomal protein L11 methyltransferase
MDYIEVAFQLQTPTAASDLLIARLTSLGFEGFQETEDALLAYIPEDNFNEKLLLKVIVSVSDKNKIRYTLKKIKEQNWNEEWEKNFSPVLIHDRILIRAPFHDKIKGVELDIIIEPKMAFGTAHHETTAQVLELMLDQKMLGATVLDMGCGTAVLAILAEKKGATEIRAVDNDEWAYRNALENIEKNNCRKIRVELGETEKLGNEKFDYILANINRNILLKDIPVYVKHLKSKGVLVLSGFYEEDIPVIQEKASQNGLVMTGKVSRNAWAAVSFTQVIT